MGAAILTAIPLVVNAAPQIVGLISGLVNLIHRHENKPATTAVSATTDGTSVTVTGVTAPAITSSGPDKKAAVLGDFQDIVLPFLAPGLSIVLKRPINAAELMPEVSELIDVIVRINHTLGLFQSSKAD